MAVAIIKKYKIIKDENGNKIKVDKTEKEWNKDTCGGTKIYYFFDRYIINGKTKQYTSRLFEKKSEAKLENSLFLADPIKYIMEHSKRAKKSLEIIKIQEKEKSKNKVLNDYFPEFIEYKADFLHGSSSYTDKRNWELYIKEDFGELTPNKITLELVQRWHENSNKKISKKTGNKYAVKTKNTWHTTLSEFLQYLFKNGKIEVNYARVVGCFKNSKENKNKESKIRYQTEEEYNLFMSVVDDPFWYKFFNFLFWHGPRKGEQRALKIKEVKLAFKSIKFKRTFSRTKDGGESIGPIKNGKEREIYLASQSFSYVEEQISFYKQMDGYSEEWFLFGGPIAIYKNRIDDKLNYYYDKLEAKYPDRKITRLTHHEFGRHSHASYLLNEGLKKGIPIEEIYSIIATRLGDTIEVIKKTYAHLYEKESNDKAKDILNQIL